MNEAPDTSGLHEYVDVEIKLGEPVTPAQEQTLHEVLGKEKGVMTVSIIGQKLAVNYEPVFVSEKELLAVIERAGVRIEEAKVTASSALTDAFEQDLQAPAQERERA